MSGFLDFVRKQGVVGLAVGLAIGAAAGKAVEALVVGFINPIVGYLLGGVSLENKVWDTGLERGGAELTFSWGMIVSAVITLLATAFVIYYVVHAAKLDRMDKADE